MPPVCLFQPSNREKRPKLDISAQGSWNPLSSARAHFKESGVAVWILLHTVKAFSLSRLMGSHPWGLLMELHIIPSFYSFFSCGEALRQFICVCAASGRHPGDIVIERTGIPGVQWRLCFYWNGGEDVYRIPEHISSYLTSETGVPEFFAYTQIMREFLNGGKGGLGW